MRHWPTVMLTTLLICGGVAATAAADGSESRAPEDGAGTAEPGGPGAGPSVVGSAVNGFPAPFGPGSVRLTVFARIRDGRARGFVQADGTAGAALTRFHVAGPVTCLLVVGNQASVKYRFTQASGLAASAMLRGGGVEVFIQDNGPPRDGHPVDENAFGAPMQQAAFDASQPSHCDPPVAPYSPVRSGDYTVRPGVG